MTLTSLLLSLCLWAGPIDAGPRKNYWVYATAESDDTVHLVRFGPGGARVEKTIVVGTIPTEIEGPHGINISKDGRHWYLSIAHGFPNGSVYKFKTGSDEIVATAQAGLFPATLDIAASTGLLYVVNFNLHGDMIPSTVSVIDSESMTEVAQIPAGVMPHGSRLNPSGSRHYSVSMMSDELLEIDAFKFKVTRRLAFSNAPSMMTKMRSGDLPGEMPMDQILRAKPTWVQLSPSGESVFVACNKANQVVEVDLEKWEVARTFPTAAGPYNLEVAPNGKILIVTHKGHGSTGFWDLQTGTVVATVPNSRKVTHGVAVSSDSRYAFVTAEGIGGEPGSVDIFDLLSFKLVATVDVGKQAAGIAFWRMQ